MFGCRFQSLLWFVVWFAFAASLTVGAAWASDGILVSRGEDAMVFGTCVPSMMVENKSSETIDFVEVDLVVGLANGQESTVALQSAYREGILRPVAPGTKAILKQPLDLTKSLGVPCNELKARKVSRIVCEAQGGRNCSSAVSVEP